MPDGVVDVPVPVPPVPVPVPLVVPDGTLSVWPIE